MDGKAYSKFINYTSSRAALFVLTIGATVVEAIILQSLGFNSALPLAPQVSAPAPFGVFHDMRWVWTYAWSWWSLVWQLAALIAFRSVLDTLIIAAAWPEKFPRPQIFTLWRRSLLYIVIGIVVMSPWVTFAFIAGLTAYGWFLLAAIVASLAMALVMPAGIITGEWWRRILPWRTMPYVLLAWFAMMFAALAITFSPAWFTVVIAGVTGIVNAILWRKIVKSVTKAGKPKHTIPVAPIAIVVVIAVFVVGGGYLYGSNSGGQNKKSHNSGKNLKNQPVQQYANRSIGEPVIFVNGFRSKYDGGKYDLLGAGITTWYYSYDGINAKGQPKPYKPKDTYQSLEVSAKLLAKQVNYLHQKTNKPVTIIAESEGTMIARKYFAITSSPPVDMYIQSSPLIRPSRVFYPSESHTGFGLVGGREAQSMLKLIHLENPDFHIQADIPFLRSMARNAPLLRDQTLCPIPGVKTFMFIPLQAAMMAERAPLSRIPWVALPGWHATLLQRGTVQQDIRHLLKTGKLRHRPGWSFAFQLIRGAGAAWQSPALPLQARAAWHAAPKSDPAFGHFKCYQ